MYSWVQSLRLQHNHRHNVIHLPCQLSTVAMAYNYMYVTAVGHIIICSTCTIRVRVPYPLRTYRTRPTITNNYNYHNESE